MEDPGISILHYITSPSPDFVETPIESWFSDVPIWGAVVAGMRASTPVSLSWLMLMLLTLLPWPWHSLDSWDIDLGSCQKYDSNNSSNAKSHRKFAANSGTLPESR